MNNTTRWFLISVLAFLLVNSLWSQETTSAASSFKNPGWSVVPSTDVAGQQDRLINVAADSRSDAWAFGVKDAAPSPPFLEHWNGSKWNIVASPQFDYTMQLQGIAALTPNNVWVVGNRIQITHTTFYERTLIGHWDGKKWSVVPSPNAGPTEFLYAVTAVSANDIWAVGSDFSRYHTLVEHWNGTTWSIVPSPNANSSDNELYGVQALSSTDVWAVGSTSKNFGGYQPLIEHWNGSKWSITSGPHPGGQSGSQLYAVSPIAPNDVWAVGYVQEQSEQTLTEHWNGKKWSVIASPDISQGSHILRSVVALSAKDVWAVGYVVDTGSLLLHWNGTSWSVVKSPDSTLFDSQLYGAAIAPEQGIWAVGTAIHQSGEMTLTDFYG